MSMKNKGVTRRTFLAGAGVGALGVAASSMFGCAPESGNKSKASASEESTKTAVQNTDVAMSETVETDVVIIGTGVSGLTAAISAAEGGAKVIVLEKLDGLKKVYDHSITAVGTSFQKELGEDWTPEELVAFWNQYPDSDSFMDKEAQLFAATFG